MSLLLRIIELPENCSPDVTTKTFTEQGGSIGRGADNYWVLDDPDCYLSSRHSEISYEHGVYKLTDLSTNGTFLNGSKEPMGKGNKIELQDGDEIELSDYKFRISLQGGAQRSPASPFEGMDTQESNTDSDYGLGDPFRGGDGAYTDSVIDPYQDEIDPLKFINNDSDSDSHGDGFIPDDNSFNNNRMDDSITWPDVSNELGEEANSPGIIPENWHDDLFTNDSVEPIAEPKVKPQPIPRKPAARRPPPSTQLDNKKIQALENENNRLQNELKNLKQHYAQLQTRNINSSHPSIDVTMVTAMGLPVPELDQQQIMDINQTVGELVRETIIDMIAVLNGRNEVKKEFRMNMTTIQPIENNPLKFSANVDDALENMFIKKGSSYIKPIDAMKDGFHGIAEHQVAIIAGMRAAFHGMRERFEPYGLETRFERQGKGMFGFIPLIRNARNWQQFIFYYNNLFGERDSFQELFGEEFVQAYEEQLRT